MQIFAEQNSQTKNFKSATIMSFDPITSLNIELTIFL